MESTVNAYQINRGVALPSESDVNISLSDCKRLEADEGVLQIETSATTKNEKPGPLIVVAPKPQQQVSYVFV